MSVEYIVINFVQQMKKSFDFNGVASRKEYWTFTLASAIIAVEIMVFAPFLLGIYQLVTLPAGISLLVRRFRDADVTPWAILAVVPIYVVIFMKSRKKG